MTAKALILALALCGLLGLAGWVSLELWTSLGDSEIGLHGRLALFLGAGFSLLLGMGLMALVFFSSRCGHDERQHRWPLDEEVQGPHPDQP